MAYTKTTWVDNSPPAINAANLNKIENGIEDHEQRIEALEQGGGGLTDGVKAALLQIAQKVAYIDEHGQDYYDDLYDALYAVTAVSVSPTTLNFSTLGSTQQLTATTTPSGATVTWTSSNTAVATVDSTGLVTSVAYGTATITATSGSVSASCSVVVAQATVTSIDAVYTQSGTVYDTDSIDTLKDDLVVTAHWSNGTTSTVASADYTLSGTLAEGTSTVTVSYSGQTDTFDVTVTADSREYIYRWDLTQSIVDSVSGQEIALTGATRDSSGLHFTAAAQLAILSDALDPIGKTVELDISQFEFMGNANNHVRLLMTANTQYGTGALIHRSNYGWSAYGWVNAVNGSNRLWSETGWGDLCAGNNDNINAFNQKTVKVVFEAANEFLLYVNETLIGTISDVYLNNVSQRTQKMIIGGITNNTSQSSGDQCYDMTITGIRIYENE